VIVTETDIPEADPASFSLPQALLTSFDTNDRINHYMIKNLPSRGMVRRAARR
jgi:hypothetical protein